MKLAWMVLALLALTLTAAGCSREPTPALRIGTNVWIGSEPLYLARDLGQLPAERVRLVEYPSASEVLRAFRNQALDGMVISLDELLVLAADGLHPKIVLVIDVSHGADAIVGRAGIGSIAELKGKRVAVESGALGAFVLARALALNDMKPADVQIVHLESNEHPAAFKEGRIDASVTFDPFRAQMLGAGGKSLFDSTRIPGEIVDLLAVRASVLERNPDALKALLGGWFAAIAYLQRDPQDAAKRMGVRQQTSGEQFLATLKGLTFPSREENLRMLAGANPALAQTGRRLMDLMLESKLLRAPVPIDTIVAPAPLESLPR